MKEILIVAGLIIMMVVSIWVTNDRIDALETIITANKMIGNNIAYDCREVITISEEVTP